MSATREILLEEIEALWTRARKLEKLNEASAKTELLDVQNQISMLIKRLSNMPQQDLKDARILRG
jgi:hypothetical protein